LSEIIFDTSGQALCVGYFPCAGDESAALFASDMDERANLVKARDAKLKDLPASAGW